MSIDLILFFIALFSQLSLSLYFMTLTILKTVMLLSLPLSLSIELSSFGIGLIFPHSYIQVRHSWPEYIIDVSFSMNDIWKHTPSLCPSWVISIFIIWSRCCAISALNVTVLSFANGDQSLERHLRPCRSPAPCENYLLDLIYWWFLPKPIFIMIAIKW